MVTVYLIVWQTHSVFHNAASFHIPASNACIEVFNFLYIPCQYLLFFLFLIMNILIAIRDLYLIKLFWFGIPNDDIEHLSLSNHLYIFLREVCIQTFCIFKTFPNDNLSQLDNENYITWIKSATYFQEHLLSWYFWQIKVSSTSIISSQTSSFIPRSASFLRELLHAFFNIWSDRQIQLWAKVKPGGRNQGKIKLSSSCQLVLHSGQETLGSWAFLWLCRIHEDLFLMPLSQNKK